jgi:hypothetical protein
MNGRYLPLQRSVLLLPADTVRTVLTLLHTNILRVCSNTHTALQLFPIHIYTAGAQVCVQILHSTQLFSITSPYLYSRQLSSMVICTGNNSLFSIPI